MVFLALARSRSSKHRRVRAPLVRARHGLAPTLLPSELCRVAAKLDQALIDDALVLGLQEEFTWTLMKDVGHFAMSDNPEALLRYLLPILRDS